MVTTTYRPGSLISASRLETSLSAPPGPGHYTLKRISYISELPASEPFVPRPRSILRSASFTMGLGFKDKEKGKGKDKQHSRPAKMPIPAPSTPAFASTSVKNKPTTSHGLFSSLTKSKTLKKKRSLSSLLDESAPTTRPSAPRATRARSSDAASTLASVPTVSKEKRLSPEKQRLEEYRQMHLRPLLPKPIRSTPKNRWKKRLNMRLHADYGACYMQAYDSILLENDRQSDLLLRRLNPLKNPSFYDLTGEEPFSVLDLGCGAGHWLMEAASYWKQAIVTGVDIVDILVPEAHDHHQIDFIQGNFLVCPWPFQNNSFDFVRMANLSLCIPYDKWEPIISEIHRVLRINGRFELIDDQIIFPYAPAPVLRPVYGVEEDEDDAASVNTDSTLVSDGDITPHTRRRSSISIAPADPHNSVSQQLPFRALPGTDLPTTPNSVLTIKPADTLQKSYSDWSTEAAACRDMETVFQNMLHKEYGIHSQPSKFVPDVIQHVFGNMEKTKSYHLKLAPKDAHKEYGAVEADGFGSLDKESALESKKSSRSKWFCPGPDKEEKKRSKKISKPSTPTSGGRSSPALDTPIPEGLSAKAAGRLGITDDMTVSGSRVPENVSAKAAHTLGIPMSGERATEIPILSIEATMSPNTTSDVLEDTPFPSRSPSPAPLVPVTSSPPKDNRQSIISLSGSSGDSKLSAKAANRLGISYSALSEATALAKASTRRPISSSSTLVAGPTTHVQSPGLLVWPDRFIPMSPEELEMHALKNVHMLIGCKPALMDHIRTFLDEDGNRMASDEDFEQSLWEYECFRRRRLNWPADIPSDWEADIDVDAPDFISIPTSKPGADTPASATSATPRTSTPLPDNASPLDKIDELTHVRTICVFEAAKREEYTLSTMKNPRPSPPSPLR